MNSVDFHEQFFYDVGIEPIKEWEMCTNIPKFTLLLSGDHDRSWGYKLAPLLDAGIPVLIYNGNKDYICNSYGAYLWTNALVWRGQMEYQR